MDETCADGDIAPMADICDLAQSFDATTFMDDCHGTGVLGDTGRGTAEHCGVVDQVDVINSTLGKALGGGLGGYTAARQEFVDTLRQRGRPYLFSNSGIGFLLLLFVKCGSLID